MGDTAVIEWALACWMCKEAFLLREAKVTDDNFVVCPHCHQWSGIEIKNRRPSLDTETFSDPGQDRLISDIFVWLCEDPKTTLESFSGFMVDGVPFQAISGSRTQALKMRPYIERAKSLTGKKFRLVRFQKDEVIVEL